MQITVQIEELEIMMSVIITNGIECNVITPALTTTLISQYFVSNMFWITKWTGHIGEKSCFELNPIVFV